MVNVYEAQLLLVVVELSLSLLKFDILNYSTPALPPGAQLTNCTAITNSTALNPVPPTTPQTLKPIVNVCLAVIYLFIVSH